MHTMHISLETLETWAARDLVGAQLLDLDAGLVHDIGKSVSKGTHT